MTLKEENLAEGMEIKENTGEKVSQDMLLDMLTKQDFSWQAIIYDLINSEQLDPWDIDIVYLSAKYIEKIKLLEEANFNVSSKVLLAASILLRMKSEILLDTHLKGIDEILFGKKVEIRKPVERLHLDSNDLPMLYPRTPIPRFKKVSLKELMDSLNNAMNTEMRRIRKEVVRKALENDTEVVLPKMKINIKDRIKNFYAKVLTSFKKKQERLSYNDLTGKDREERLACFLPMLHLENQYKLYLQQESHFDEIWVWVYKHYKGQEKAMKKEIADIEREEEIEKETGFENPMGDLFIGEEEAEFGIDSKQQQSSSSSNTESLQNKQEI